MRRHRLSSNRFLLILAILGALAVVQPAEGQVAGAFARRGFGPRGIAMGNAQTADVFGHGSPWYNPALGPSYSNQSIDASYTFLSHDRRLEYVQFLVPMPPRAGIGAGLIHAGVTNIDGRDASGYHTEYYSTDEFAGFLAFGSRVGEKASVGIAFRFYRSDLLPDLGAASSIGIAVGAAYRVNESWALGLAVDDILSRYEWDTSDVAGSSGRKTTDDFPIRLRVGSAYRTLNDRLILSAEFESRFESVRGTTRTIEVLGGVPLVIESVDERTLHTAHLRAGAEYRFADVFLVRAGLDRLTDGSLSEIIPSLGFSVDQQLGDLGAGFQYVFGKEAYSLGTFHVIGIQLNI
ncbi:MAG TPA: PorV/PorQ family protein [Rhodothermales bacterium]|nr:PorV/PorQ family protein [Rhodothermales bacterium]